MFVATDFSSALVPVVVRSAGSQLIVALYAFAFAAACSGGSPADANSASASGGAGASGGASGTIGTGGSGGASVLGFFREARQGLSKDCTISPGTMASLATTGSLYKFETTVISSSGLQLSRYNCSSTSNCDTLGNTFKPSDAANTWKSTGLAKQWTSALPCIYKTYTLEVSILPSGIISEKQSDFEAENPSSDGSTCPRIEADSLTCKRIQVTELDRVE